MKEVNLAGGKNIIDEPPAIAAEGHNNQQLLEEPKLDEPEGVGGGGEVGVGEDGAATLQIVHSEPKEVVENEENVLEENRKSGDAKDFKVHTGFWVGGALVWLLLFVLCFSFFCGEGDFGSRDDR